MQVGLVLLALLAAYFCTRMGEWKRSEFLAQQAEVLRAKGVAPMHHPPIQRDTIALAEKDCAAFCHPKEGSADGCRMYAIFMDDQWIAFAAPYIGNPETRCCAADREHFFICSRDGALRLSCDPSLRYRIAYEGGGLRSSSLRPGIPCRWWACSN